MMGSLVAVSSWVLVVAVLLAASTASTAARRPGGPWERPRPSTAALWLVVVVPSLVQLVVPALLPALERDWARIGSGQLWRLVTSVVVQDGGPLGLVFNLFCLTLVLVAAQRYWSAGRVWITFWVGAVLSNLAVGPVLEPVGGGNSMAVFALGSALVSNLLLSRPDRRALLWAGVAIACMALMAAGRDYHAVSCAIGLAAGLVPPHGPHPQNPDPQGPHQGSHRGSQGSREGLED